jgi:hypothetical protein
METQSVELHRHEQETEQPYTVRPEFSLPQADGGKDAWLFLAAAFFVEALVWGKVSVSHLWLLIFH